MRVPTRSTYRHGDLRRALTSAALDLARQGGPDAVLLREATRRAGVAPNAAYRHFTDRDALLGAVRQASQAALAAAMEGRMKAFVSPLAEAPDAPARARGLLLAALGACLDFAVEQPGLFRCAIGPCGSAEDSPRDPPPVGTLGLAPPQLLGLALDAHVVAGLLPATERADVQHVTWSAMHGVALSLIEGALQGTPPLRRAALAARLARLGA